MVMRPESTPPSSDWIVNGIFHSLLLDVVTPGEAGV